MRPMILLLCLVSLTAGCVERAASLSPADRERLQPYLSTTAPTPQHSLEIEFDNGVRLLGYDVESESITAGQPLTVTWYWHATEDLEDSWHLFTHIADSTGENRLNQDMEGTVRELYQPGRWQAGQFISDRQSITLPADWNNGQAVIFLGLWSGDHRLRIESGSNDGDNRVRALSLQVTSAPSAAAAPSEAAAPAAAPAPVRPPPNLRIAHTSTTIDLDGRLEAAWNDTTRSSVFVNTLNGNSAPFEARARALWDEQKLYVAFEVSDDFVSNTITERDGHLWEQDAVEIMIDPEGNGRNYVELQISPTGAVFDTRYDSRRQPQPVGHADFDSHLQAGVRVDGVANDTSADRGYTVEVAIPWAAFGTNAPGPGSAWRANFYVMDKRAQGPMRSAGWSPTHTNDFHVPARFGRMTFLPAPAAPAVAAVNTGATAGGSRFELPQALADNLREVTRRPGRLPTGAPAMPNQH